MASNSVMAEIYQLPHCGMSGARRMAKTAALLADEVLPEHPLRQWVLSLPHALRFLLATDPAAMTLVQRFGSALNLPFTNVLSTLSSVQGTRRN